MKKKIAVIAAVVTCVLALMACTPKVEDLKAEYKDKYYAVASVSSEYLKKYDIETEDMDYGFMASKLVETVVVIGFKKSGKAKEVYEELKEKFGGTLTVKKKGNAVFIGSEGAVNVGA